MPFPVVSFGPSAADPRLRAARIVRPKNRTRTAHLEFRHAPPFGVMRSGCRAMAERAFHAPADRGTPHPIAAEVAAQKTERVRPVVELILESATVPSARRHDAASSVARFLP